MKVWIEQDLCTGVALCEQTCPDLFAMADDGVAHVVNADGQLLPGGQAAPVPAELLDSAIDAAEDCPENCIFIDS